MYSLCPRVIPGAPGKVTPATCTPGADNSVMYQMLGANEGRCGSFASSGLPDAVRLPETTQLLLACARSAASSAVDQPGAKASVVVLSCPVSEVNSTRGAPGIEDGSREVMRGGFVSPPTTKTSRAELSTRRALRLASGRFASEARMMSVGH